MTKEIYFRMLDKINDEYRKKREALNKIWELLNHTKSPNPNNIVEVDFKKDKFKSGLN